MKKSLKELAALTESKLFGDEEHLIDGVNTLKGATTTEASFLSNRKYLSLLKKSQAGLICIDEKISFIKGKNYLVSKDPSLTFQKLIHLFSPKIPLSSFTKIHPSASIHPTAKLGDDLQIAPFVVIDCDCEIGDRTYIAPHVSIAPKVVIGKDVTIHAHVVIREGCKIGDRVILQPGCVIGGCGFGYITDKEGKHLKIEHRGTVILEDDTEIGANTTIDRARFKETIIKKGSKIDNLVMIAHNVSIGENNLIIAQSGVAGSSKTGRRVILAAQTGVVGHITIEDETVLMARGAFTKSIVQKGLYGGAPALPAKRFFEQQIHIKRLPFYIKKLHKKRKKMSIKLKMALFLKKLFRLN